MIEPVGTRAYGQPIPLGELAEIRKDANASRAAQRDRDVSEPPAKPSGLLGYLATPPRSEMERACIGLVSVLVTGAALSLGGIYVLPGLAVGVAGFKKLHA
ncbi:MAG: hypothetical protein AAFY60_14870 [Myxococcota bacterium]